MAPASLDLAPFGFTATESQAYATLLRLGPSTGYAVAHAARLARANTYGALEGLVARGAAARLPGRPARYRAADPPALLAQLAAQQGAALERLGRALKDVTRPAAPATRCSEGARAAAEPLLHPAGRAGRRGAARLPAGPRRPPRPAWRRAAAAALGRATLRALA